jgi:heptose-I-phosphate ethanolaminephosphotransferase
MNNTLLTITTALAVFLYSCLIYLRCNRGMARNARGQQTRRFFFATVAAFAPLAVSGNSVLQPQLLLALFVALTWMTTYPLLYHLTNRKSSPDYENYMDIAFGLYTFGWLSGIILLTQHFLPGNRWILSLLSIVELLLLIIAVFQIVYYLIYKVCMDANGMKILQETHWNEIIEFSKSFTFIQNLGMILPVVAVTAACFLVNFQHVDTDQLTVPQVVMIAALTIFYLYYTWKPRHSVFSRTGIAELFAVVKEYVENNHRYTNQMEQRISDLIITPLSTPPADLPPHTIFMVIGESACRDYMSAFHPEMKEDTTPWLRQSAEDQQHFLLFPNTYSCAMQTVPTLEKALTEYNQYNGKAFYESCSIVDVARKLGYRIHWYSNQGHLGSFDTPITLVAETSDVAKWTKQELGKVQYDESLIDFLDEVDPGKNNFVVLHLKGSHFNFMSRYQQAFTRWGTPGVQDNVVNYKNSICYTDSILQQFFEYGKTRLNLQAMLYFSDHATEPGRRRKPNFEGFQMTRIPMFAYFSDEYIRLHPNRVSALQKNREKYFTNDLVYDLMCGIFDIQSNHFDESASLASNQYRFTRDMLLTYEGQKHIAEDK